MAMRRRRSPSSNGSSAMRVSALQMPAKDSTKSQRSALDMVIGLMGRRRSCSKESTAPSDCSTRCPSEPGSSDEEGSPSLLPFAVEAGVIIFDWDDTLFPTSWLRAHACGGGGKIPLAQLREHAKLVESALRAARAVAKVYIVTLAKCGWVIDSGNKYLPGLDIEALLVELGIEVHYAREEPCPGCFNAGKWRVLKRSAMRNLLTEHCTQVDGIQSVLSIGDATIEQDALNGLDLGPFSGSSQRLARKTLKLMDEPTMPQLSEELRRLTPLLRPLAGRTKGFEARVNVPGEVNAANLRI